LAATLRAKAEDIPWYPALWKEPKPTKSQKAIEQRHQKTVFLGPLAGEGIWYKDPVRRRIHSELTRAGMERARQAGKLIGVLPMEKRDGFAEKFASVLLQLEQKTITRKQAAEQLSISGPTLKRLLDNYLTIPKRTSIASEERVAVVV